MYVCTVHVAGHPSPPLLSAGTHGRRRYVVPAWEPRAAGCVSHCDSPCVVPPPPRPLPSTTTHTLRWTLVRGPAGATGCGWGGGSCASTVAKWWENDRGFEGGRVGCKSGRGRPHLCCVCVRGAPGRQRLPAADRPAQPLLPTPPTPPPPWSVWVCVHRLLDDPRRRVRGTAAKGVGPMTWGLAGVRTRPPTSAVDTGQGARNDGSRHSALRGLQYGPILDGNLPPPLRRRGGFRPPPFSCFPHLVLIGGVGCGAALCGWMTEGGRAPRPALGRLLS